MKLWKKLVVGILLGGNTATCVSFYVLLIKSWSNSGGMVLMSFRYENERLLETIAVPLFLISGLILVLWILWKCEKNEETD